MIRLRLVNEANSYLNKIVPNARGEAAKLIQEATAYKEQVVKQAEGVAQNFIDVYNSYKDAKEVTRRRIYLETFMLNSFHMNYDIILIFRSCSSRKVLPWTYFLIIL